MSGIYHHIRFAGRAILRLILLVCLSPPVFAQIGFQADFDPIPSWISKYEIPDYRLSVANPPKSYPSLELRPTNVPAFAHSSFKNNSLTFNTTYYRHGRTKYDLVPVTVDAMDFAEFQKDRYEDKQRGFIFEEKVSRSDRQGGAGGLGVNVALPKRLNKIFGEGGAGLRVSGFRKITFSGRSQWTDGQSNVLRQNKFPSLSMEQISRFDITGTIGTKISVKVSQDSETDIPLANRIQIRYKGDEDDILKSIEAGNTTLSLPNTQFVGYSQRIQGLFGLRTEAQLGSLTFTAIASQEKGNSEKTSITATGEESAVYIRDADYADNRVFDLGLPAIYDSLGVLLYNRELLPGDSIIELFVFEQEPNQLGQDTTIPASLNVKPQDSGRFVFEDLNAQYGVNQLEYGKEFTYEQVVTKGIYYIQFNTRRQENRALGVYMEVQRPGVGLVTFGDISAPPYNLKLIRSDNPLPTFETWKLMWRNVYDLRQRSTLISELNVKVFKGLPGREGTTSSLEYQDISGESQNYVEILGLDQYNTANDTIADGLVDDRQEIWREDWGLLIFPSRTPFATDTVFVNKNGDSTASLAVKVPTLYNYQSRTERTEKSQYYVQVSTKSRSSIIRLSRPNIIEGSERLLLNGRPLRAGEDYTINYDFGQITLLSDDALDPNSELTIDYEYTGFFAIQKKTLLGMRAEYEWSKNFNFGSTILYKSDKAQERKPRVGQETSKMAVIDFDASLKLQPNFLTDLADAIPLVETTVPSALQLSGEIARSYPNPNVNGEAYVDDFEAAIEQLSLSKARTLWKRSSPPDLVKQSPASYTRGRLLWHVPVGARNDALPLVEQVYNRQPRQGEGTITTLRLVFKPDPSNDTTNLSSWAGITRYFGGRVDANRVQLFEFRARGNGGKVRFEFGTVSEDLNGNNLPDGEDNISLNGYVDSTEDRGLDLFFDGVEKDTVFWGTSKDVAGDNFYINDGNGNEAGKCPYPNCGNIDWLDRSNYYTWLNGTEGNRDDAEYLGIPDEEALSSRFQTANSYFSFEVDLANTPFLIPNTKSSGGFQTYRIPILDTASMDKSLFDVVEDGGNRPNWANINHVRVWFESAPGDTTEDTLEIADWYFVQSNWQDSVVQCDVTDPAACHPILADSERTSFIVASLSEEDNEDFKSNPTPGVEQYVDPATNVAEPRRALLLKFPTLQRGDTCMATKDLFTVDRYSGYGRMQMYVYSDIPMSYSSINDDSLVFFFRLGTNETNFYEYRTRLYNNWDERNWVNIDFNQITAIKDSAQKLLPSAERNRAVDVASGKYRIFGDPNLNEILYFTAGVVSTFDTAAAGEIWLDELRVTDVRKDAGTAIRFNMAGNMADLTSFSFAIQSQDPYFRGLSSATRGGSNNNLGSGQTNTSYSINWSLSMDKFFPPSWSARLPLSVRYTKSIATPLLRTRSDVVLPNDVRKEEQTVNETQSLSFSESFNRKGRSPLFNLLLNRQSVSLSYSRTEGRSVNTPYSFGENYAMKGNFNMGITKPPTIPIFFWTKWIPIFKKTSESRLGLYPSSWTLNASYTRNIRISEDINRKRTTTLSREFSGGMDVRYNVFDNLNTSFSYSTRRDLINLDEIIFSLRNPKLGTELNYRQRFGLKYDPKLLTWLTVNYSFDASYSDDYDRTSGSRRSSLAQTWGMGGTFDHNRLFGASGAGAGDRQRFRGRRGVVRTGEGKEEEKENESGGGKPLIETPKAIMRFLTGWIEPITYSYGKGYKNFVPGMMERPGFQYRFGLSRDADVPLRSDTRTPSAGEDESYSFGSGFNFWGGIATTVKYSRAQSRELIKQGARYLNSSVSWPDLSIRISPFRKFPLIKGVLNKFIDVFSPRTGYSRRVQESQDIEKGFLISRKETIAHNPLLSINFKVWRSLSLSGSYAIDKSEEDRFNTGTGSLQTSLKTQNESISGTTRYSFSAPGGITIPLIGKVKFRSTVDFDVQFRLSTSLSETSQQGKPYFVSSDKSDFTISPTISYAFSRQIRGGLQGRWQDTKDVQTNRNSHVRQLQIWVEIRF